MRGGHELIELQGGQRHQFAHQFARAVRTAEGYLRPTSAKSFEEPAESPTSPTEGSSRRSCVHSVWAGQPELFPQLVFQDFPRLGAGQCVNEL
jgi:hypothetical protein